MLEQEMAQVSRDILENVMKVQADEEVVIVTDGEKADVARAIGTAARSLDSTSNIIITPRRDAHGAELPESVGAAMKEADVTVDANTHAITHTKARREASEAGVRHLVLRGVTPQMMVDGTVSTDFSKVRPITMDVATIQTEATSAHGECPNGTDITVSLEGRDSLHKGVVPGDIDTTPLIAFPQSKSAITPIEGTSQGKIVWDASIDNIGTLDEPVEAVVEDGLVTEINGGRDAQRLERIVEEAGEGARNIAEAPSFGTNPDVELMGLQCVDKKVLGTVHYAIGDNRSLGGKVRSDIHLDGVVSKPTVSFSGETFDDVTIVERGRFDIEKAHELAESLR